MIIFICGNLAGAYHKHLMELALQQTYQDTCNCIKSRIKLEFEKRQQVKGNSISRPGFPGVIKTMPLPSAASMRLLRSGAPGRTQGSPDGHGWCAGVRSATGQGWLLQTQTQGPRPQRLPSPRGWGTSDHNDSNRNPP